MLETHVVLFKLEKGWTPDLARKELANLNLKAYKPVHRQEHYLRYSITPKTPKGNYVSKVISPEKGITMIFEVLKDKPIKKP